MREKALRDRNSSKFTIPPADGRVNPSHCPIPVHPASFGPLALPKLLCRIVPLTIAKLQPQATGRPTAYAEENSNVPAGFSTSRVSWLGVPAARGNWEVPPILWRHFTVVDWQLRNSLGVIQQGGLSRGVRVSCAADGPTPVRTLGYVG